MRFFRQFGQVGEIRIQGPVRFWRVWWLERVEGAGGSWREQEGAGESWRELERAGGSWRERRELEGAEFGQLVELPACCGTRCLQSCVRLSACGQRTRGVPPLSPPPYPDSGVSASQAVSNISGCGRGGPHPIGGGSSCRFPRGQGPTLRSSGAGNSYVEIGAVLVALAGFGTAVALRT